MSSFKVCHKFKQDIFISIHHNSYCTPSTISLQFSFFSSLYLVRHLSPFINQWKNHPWLYPNTKWDEVKHIYIIPITLLILLPPYTMIKFFLHYLIKSMQFRKMNQKCINLMRSFIVYWGLFDMLSKVRLHPSFSFAYLNLFLTSMKVCFE